MNDLALFWALCLVLLIPFAVYNYIALRREQHEQRKSGA